MAQASTVSADAANGPRDRYESILHSNSDLANASSDDSLTEQRLQRFITDETRTTVSFNTVEHKAKITDVEAAEQRIAKELQDFDETFQEARSKSSKKKRSSRKTAKRG